MNVTAHARALSLRTALGLVILAGCEASDPTPTARVDAGAGDGGAGANCSADSTLRPVVEGTCTRPADDYTPRSPSSDAWPACIADSNAYAPFEASISALSRVAAFEEIRSLLGFGSAKVPSSDDFLQARVLYSQDQGIESRVSRREDEHYAAAPKLCRDMSEAELVTYRERCVGPAILRPILNDAFVKGIGGETPTVQAARIEASLLAWLYFSVFKESTSARDAAKDCDSMWAKYSGGRPRESAEHVSLARYVHALSVETHERIYDGLLAVRCWRDLDNPTGVATNTSLHLRARTQLDRALLRGLALVTAQRAEASAGCSSAWEGVRVLGAVLAREAKERDAAKGAALEAALARTPEVGGPEVARLLVEIFPCP